MHIAPRRRRRAMRAHYLAQRGLSQRQIAEQMDVSRATVRDDLQLVETHWSQIAAPAADDLLLESLHLLQLRLALALKNDEVADNAARLTAPEYLKARDHQETRLNALAREIRRTVQQVHQRAEQRPDQPDLYQEQPQEQPKPVKTTPELTKPDQPHSTISSPQQEIVQSEAPAEKIPPEPDQDALIEEAVQHFPHLKGQSPEQILHFLDQLTDPNTDEGGPAGRIYAEAAG
ncbi:MAG: HTH domain-containing protein [Chloroflexota bacterium]|nr:HTH domain-containing protein [Chloroflexota bacterium]